MSTRWGSRRSVASSRRSRTAASSQDTSPAWVHCRRLGCRGRGAGARREGSAVGAWFDAVWPDAHQLLPRLIAELRAAVEEAPSLHGLLEEVAHRPVIRPHDTST